MALNIAMTRASACAADPCGDKAHAWHWPGHALLAIADGLGRGACAAYAANRAITHISNHLGEDPCTVMRDAHQALSDTRGAALGIAIIQTGPGALRYAAIGNIRAAIFSWTTTRLDASPGIAGARMRRLHEHCIPMRSDGCLALWTDGISEQLSMTPAERVADDLAPVADALMTRFRTGQDDACIILARLRMPEAAPLHPCGSARG